VCAEIDSAPGASRRRLAVPAPSDVMGGVFPLAADSAHMLLHPLRYAPLVLAIIRLWQQR